MNEDIYSLLSAIESLRIELDEMRKERDEARREVCFLVSESDVYNHISTSPEDVAEEYGWNCFNNHKPKE